MSAAPAEAASSKHEEDEDENFRVLCFFPTLLSKSQVTAHLSTTFNSKLFQNEELGACVDSEWDARVRKNPMMFNKTKFRLHGVRVSDSAYLATKMTFPHCSSPQHYSIAELKKNSITDKGEGDIGLVVELGVDDYKSFIGTNLLGEEQWKRSVAGQKAQQELKEQVVKEGEEEAKTEEDKMKGSQESESCFLSQALGIEAVVVSKDGYTVFFRRSQHVAEMPGYWCIPGGHPEPENIDFLRETLKKHAQDIILQQQKEKLIAEVADPQQQQQQQQQDQKEEKSAVPSSLSAVQASRVYHSTVQEVEAMERRSCTMSQSDKTAAERKDGNVSNLQQCIVNELFQSPLDEISDELGVPIETLHNEGLCAVTVNALTREKPDFIFVVSSTLTAAEIRKYYEKGCAREQFESQGPLMFMKTKDLVESDGDLPPILRLTPCSLSCVRVFVAQQQQQQQVVKAESAD